MNIYIYRYTRVLKIVKTRRQRRWYSPPSLSPIFTAAHVVGTRRLYGRSQRKTMSRTQRTQNKRQKVTRESTADRYSRDGYRGPKPGKSEQNNKLRQKRAIIKIDDNRKNAECSGSVRKGRRRIKNARKSLLGSSVPPTPRRTADRRRRRTPAAN